MLYGAEETMMEQLIVVVLVLVIVVPLISVFVRVYSQ